MIWTIMALLRCQQCNWRNRSCYVHSKAREHAAVGPGAGVDAVRECGRGCGRGWGRSRSKGIVGGGVGAGVAESPSIKGHMLTLPTHSSKAGAHLEVELSAGVGLQQDLTVHFAQPWLHCTLRCQPAHISCFSITKKDPLHSIVQNLKGRASLQHDPASQRNTLFVACSPCWFSVAAS